MHGTNTDAMAVSSRPSNCGCRTLIERNPPPPRGVSFFGGFQMNTSNLGARGKLRGFSPGAAARPLDRTRAGEAFETKLEK